MTAPTVGNHRLGTNARKFGPGHSVWRANQYYGAEGYGSTLPTPYTNGQMRVAPVWLPHRVRVTSAVFNVSGAFTITTAFTNGSSSGSTLTCAGGGVPIAMTIGQTVTVVDGFNTKQTFTLAANAALNATSITITPATVTLATSTGTAYNASSSTYGALFRPVIYSDTNDLPDQLRVDFGTVDAFVGDMSWPTNADPATATKSLWLGEEEGERIWVGGAQQGAPTVLPKITSAVGHIPGVPILPSFPLAAQVPSGLLINGVTGAPPTSPTGWSFATQTPLIRLGVA